MLCKMTSRGSKRAVLWRFNRLCVRFREGGCLNLFHSCNWKRDRRKGMAGAKRSVRACYQRVLQYFFEKLTLLMAVKPSFETGKRSK